jgi:hypothetical protein
MFFYAGCLLRVALPGWSLSQECLLGEQITSYDRYTVTDYIFPTMIWMNLTYLLLLFGFIKFVHKDADKFNIQPIFERNDFFILAISLYVISFAGSVISFSDVMKEVIGSLRKATLFLLVFNALYIPSKKHFRVLLILIFAEILNAVFFGFYKGVIIEPLSYLLVYFFLNQKKDKKSIFTIKTVASFGLILIFMFSFVFPFITYKRVISGFDPRIGIATQKYSNIDILKLIIEGNSNMLSVDQSKEAFYERMSAIQPNAFFYKDVSIKQKFLPELSITAVYLYVPRFIWPNKPINSVGLMPASYVRTGSFAKSDVMDQNSYIYVGLFAGKYVFGGIIAVILFSFLTGWLLAILYNCIYNYIYNPFSLSALMYLIFNALNAFEEIVDMGISVLASVILYCVLIKMTDSFFKNKVKYG